MQTSKPKGLASSILSLITNLVLLIFCAGAAAALIDMVNIGTAAIDPWVLHISVTVVAFGIITSLKFDCLRASLGGILIFCTAILFAGVSAFLIEETPQNDLGRVAAELRTFLLTVLPLLGGAMTAFPPLRIMLRDQSESNRRERL